MEQDKLKRTADDTANIFWEFFADAQVKDTISVRHLLTDEVIKSIKNNYYGGVNIPKDF